MTRAKPVRDCKDCGVTIYAARAAVLRYRRVEYLQILDLDLHLAVGHKSGHMSYKNGPKTMAWGLFFVVAAGHGARLAGGRRSYCSRDGASR